MNITTIKIYHLFWFVAAIILLVGICNPDNTTVDINIHDTYFVIAHLHLAIVLSLFYFLNGFGYWFLQRVLKKPLKKYLTLIHSVIVLGSFIFYWLLVLYCKLFLSNSGFTLFYDRSQLINITLVNEFILIAFIALPIFIVNVLTTIFKKNN